MNVKDQLIKKIKIKIKMRSDKNKQNMTKKFDCFSIFKFDILINQPPILTIGLFSFYKILSTPP